MKDKDYGCFSQWYPAEFEEDGVVFSCIEQYMMAKKALLFKDQDIYNRILKEDSPKKMKALGRKVKNFDPNIWAKERYSIVFCANMLKFGQDFKKISKTKRIYSNSFWWAVWVLNPAHQAYNTRLSTGSLTKN